MGYLQCDPRMAELGHVWLCHLVQLVLDRCNHRLLTYAIQGEHWPPSVHEEQKPYTPKRRGY
jgi:hypothetical protein